MSMFRTSKDDTYPVSVFDKCTNSEKVKKKCDIDTLKSYIKRDLEKFLNTRSLYDWRQLHSKELPPKALVKEGDDPNAPDIKADVRDNDDEIIATPEDKIPQRAFFNFFEYGLSDYTTQDLSIESECEELAEEIQAKIESFIPHLRNIKVKAVTEGRCVKILIEATLNVEDESEEIEFDTNLYQDEKAFSVNVL